MDKLHIEKYILPEDNIIALGEDSEIRKGNAEWRGFLQDEGIDWSIEIQGLGPSDYEKKELKLLYPAGDVFVSLAITAHEMGHWRQGEIDERFCRADLGAPKPNEEKAKDFSYEIEADAWERGLERVKNYIDPWREKFNEYKEKDYFADHESLDDFLNYVGKVILETSRYTRDLDNKVDQESTKQYADWIKNDPIMADFFFNQDKWHTGEKIDKEEIEILIKKVASDTAEEKY
jgi:hypothetical protein